MTPFTTLESTAAPLLKENINTDIIIPIDKLIAYPPAELGPFCFEAWRYREDGPEQPDFPLNTPRYRGAQILIAGTNFGCGSSREAAVWALLAAGIRCVIAPAFGDIFRSNCYQNGLLPVQLDGAAFEAVRGHVESGEQPRLRVDLRDCTIRGAGFGLLAFTIDPKRRQALLDGEDHIDITLKHTTMIKDFEHDKERQQPWMVPGDTQAPTRLLMLPGDGIGPEIMPQVRRVVEWFAERRNVPLELDEELYGIAAWKAHGHLMPEHLWSKILGADAILFGATGSPEYDDIPYEMRKQDQLIRIRKELDLYTNLRPVKSLKALRDASTLRPEVLEGCDMVLVRELTGGMYFGEPRGIFDLPDGQRRGVNTCSYTTSEIERIARAAFELARTRRGKLCSVDKSNVLEGGLLWRETVIELHQREYRDVELSHLYVDNCAMQLVRRPSQFDVLVTENLFGDILSDCAAMVAGSLGLLPSASLGPVDSAGRRKALYEPIHGSAPDIAGRSLANPLGAILSFAMCLRFTFGREAEAVLLEDAVEAVVSGGVRTADIAPPGVAPVSTQQMGSAVLAELERRNPHA